MQIIKLKTFNDQRGDLTPIEFRDLMFSPHRIFVVRNVPKGIRRGEHAHFRTWQHLMCLKGQINVGLHNGVTQEEAIINEGESVLIKNLIWDYQDFLTGQDVLLVMCSTEYDKMDYITDFDQFLKIVKEGCECLKK
jgi:dTDP-4-dehydrorhamnose 3,5-epimerase-like enzyme